MSDDTAATAATRGRRRSARFWQFPVDDLAWPDRPAGVVTTRVADAVTTVRKPLADRKYGRGQPVTGAVPLQRSVDRTYAFELTLVDTEIRNQAGKVIKILRTPAFGAYGFDPNDPGPFSIGVNPRTAVCGILAPQAARCGATGYW
jgi:hypothetical protein